MSLLHILSVVLKILKTNIFRTLLTTLGVSIGIAAIYLLVGIGFGLQKLTETTIATADALTTLDVISQTETLPLTDDLSNEWKKIYHVTDVSKLLTVPAQVKLDDKISDTQLNVIDSTFLSYSGLEISLGTALQDDEQQAVVVSSAVSKLFGVDDPSQLLGKEMQFSLFVETEDGSETLLKKEEKFPIVGVFPDDQISQVYIAFQQLPELKPTVYHAFKVKVDAKENLVPIRDALADKGYTVSSVAEFIEQVDKVFKVAQIVLAVFGFIALFVSAIGMFNTMTIALLERTRDIGIMKAVGIENADIWKMFVLESSLMGVMGGLIGILLGIIGGELLNVGVNLLATSLGGEAIDIFFTPLWFVLVIMIVSSSVGLLTGFYPARRASRLNVLDALRYE